MGPDLSKSSGIEKFMKDLVQDLQKLTMPDRPKEKELGAERKYENTPAKHAEATTGEKIRANIDVENREIKDAITFGTQLAQQMQTGKPLTLNTHHHNAHHQQDLITANNRAKKRMEEERERSELAAFIHKLFRSEGPVAITVRDLLTKLRDNSANGASNLATLDKELEKLVSKGTKSADLIITCTNEEFYRTAKNELEKICDEWFNDSDLTKKLGKDFHDAVAYKDPNKVVFINTEVANESPDNSEAKKTKTEEKTALPSSLFGHMPNPRAPAATMANRAVYDATSGFAAPEWMVDKLKSETPREKEVGAAALANLLFTHTSDETQVARNARSFLDAAKILDAKSAELLEAALKDVFERHKADAFVPARAGTDGYAYLNATKRELGGQDSSDAFRAYGKLFATRQSTTAEMSVPFNGDVKETSKNFLKQALELVDEGQDLSIEHLKSEFEVTFREAKLTPKERKDIFLALEKSYTAALQERYNKQFSPEFMTDFMSHLQENPDSQQHVISMLNRYYKGGDREVFLNALNSPVEKAYKERGKQAELALAELAKNPMMMKAIALGSAIEKKSLKPETALQLMQELTVEKRQELIKVYTERPGAKKDLLTDMATVGFSGEQWKYMQILLSPDPAKGEHEFATKLIGDVKTLEPADALVVIGSLPHAQRQTLVKMYEPGFDPKKPGAQPKVFNDIVDDRFTKAQRDELRVLLAADPAKICLEIMKESVGKANSNTPAKPEEAFHLVQVIAKLRAEDRAKLAKLYEYSDATQKPEEKPKFLHDVFRVFQNAQITLTKVQMDELRVQTSGDPAKARMELLRELAQVARSSAVGRAFSEHTGHLVLAQNETWRDANLRATMLVKDLPVEELKKLITDIGEKNPQPNHTVKDAHGFSKPAPLNPYLDGLDHFTGSFGREVGTFVDMRVHQRVAGADAALIYSLGAHQQVNGSKLISLVEEMGPERFHAATEILFSDSEYLGNVALKKDSNNKLTQFFAISEKSTEGRLLIELCKHGKNPESFRNAFFASKILEQTVDLSEKGPSRINIERLEKLTHEFSKEDRAKVFQSVVRLLGRDAEERRNAPAIRLFQALQADALDQQAFITKMSALKILEGAGVDVLEDPTSSKGRREISFQVVEKELRDPGKNSQDVLAATRSLMINPEGKTYFDSAKNSPLAKIFPRLLDETTSPNDFIMQVKSLDMLIELGCDLRDDPKAFLESGKPLRINVQHVYKVAESMTAEDKLRMSALCREVLGNLPGSDPAYSENKFDVAVRMFSHQLYHQDKSIEAARKAIADRIKLQAQQVSSYSELIKGLEGDAASSMKELDKQSATGFWDAVLNKPDAVIDFAYNKQGLAKTFAAPIDSVIPLPINVTEVFIPNKGSSVADEKAKLISMTYDVMSASRLNFKKWTDEEKIVRVKSKEGVIEEKKGVIVQSQECIDRYHAHNIAFVTGGIRNNEHTQRNEIQKEFLRVGELCVAKPAASVQEVRLGLAQKLNESSEKLGALQAQVHALEEGLRQTRSTLVAVGVTIASGGGAFAMAGRGALKVFGTGVVSGTGFGASMSHLSNTAEAIGQVSLNGMSADEARSKMWTQTWSDTKEHAKLSVVAAAGATTVIGITGIGKNGVTMANTSWGLWLTATASGGATSGVTMVGLTKGENWYAFDKEITELEKRGSIDPETRAKLIDKYRLSAWDILEDTSREAYFGAVAGVAGGAFMKSGRTEIKHVPANAAALTGLTAAHNSANSAHKGPILSPYDVLGATVFAGTMAVSTPSTGNKTQPFENVTRSNGGNGPKDAPPSKPARPDLEPPSSRNGSENNNNPTKSSGSPEPLPPPPPNSGKPVHVEVASTPKNAAPTEQYGPIEIKPSSAAHDLRTLRSQYALNGSAPGATPAQTVRAIKALESLVREHGPFGKTQEGVTGRAVEKNPATLKAEAVGKKLLDTIGERQARGENGLRHAEIEQTVRQIDAIRAKFKTRGVEVELTPAEVKVRQLRTAVRREALRQRDAGGERNSQGEVVQRTQQAERVAGAGKSEGPSQQTQTPESKLLNDIINKQIVSHDSVLDTAASTSNGKGISMEGLGLKHDSLLDVTINKTNPASGSERVSSGKFEPFENTGLVIDKGISASPASSPHAASSSGGSFGATSKTPTAASSNGKTHILEELVIQGSGGHGSEGAHAPKPQIQTKTVETTSQSADAKSLDRILAKTERTITREAAKSSRAETPSPRINEAQPAKSESSTANQKGTNETLRPEPVQPAVSNKPEIPVSAKQLIENTVAGIERRAQQAQGQPASPVEAPPAPRTVATQTRSGAPVERSGNQEGAAKGDSAPSTQTKTAASSAAPQTGETGPQPLKAGGSSAQHDAPKTQTKQPVAERLNNMPRKVPQESKPTVSAEQSGGASTPTHQNSAPAPKTSPTAASGLLANPATQSGMDPQTRVNPHVSSGTSTSPDNSLSPQVLQQQQQQRERAQKQQEREAEKRKESDWNSGAGFSNANDEKKKTPRMGSMSNGDDDDGEPHSGVSAIKRWARLVRISIFGKKIDVGSRDSAVDGAGVSTGEKSLDATQGGQN